MIVTGKKTLAAQGISDEITANTFASTFYRWDVTQKSKGLQQTSKAAKATPFLPLDSYISSPLHANLTLNIPFSGLRFVHILIPLVNLSNEGSTLILL